MGERLSGLSEGEFFRAYRHAGLVAVRVRELDEWEVLGEAEAFWLLFAAESFTDRIAKSWPAAACFAVGCPAVMLRTFRKGVRSGCARFGRLVVSRRCELLSAVARFIHESQRSGRLHKPFFGRLAG